MRKPPSFPRRTPDPDKTPLCRFFLLGKCQKGNSCEFRHSKKTQRVVMAVGLTGPGPDSQNQKHIVCRQFSERGSCSFGDRCKFFHDASISTGKPNPNSRGATPKTTPKGTPHGTPRGTPIGGTRRKILKASDISHPNRTQSLKSWKSMLIPQLNPVRHRKRTNLSLSPMTAYPLHVNKNLPHQANESQAARPTIHLTHGPLTTSLVF